MKSNQKLVLTESPYQVYPMKEVDAPLDAINMISGYQST